MRSLQVFYAHPRSWDDTRIQLGVDVCTSWLSSRLLPLPVAGQSPYTRLEVIPGRDDFQARFPVEGNWENWARSVAGRFADNEPRFHLMVLTPGPLGKATAALAWAFGATGRPLLQHTEAWDFHTVIGIDCLRPNDFRSGWVAILGS